MKKHSVRRVLLQSNPLLFSVRNLIFFCLILVNSCSNGSIEKYDSKSVKSAYNSNIIYYECDSCRSSGSNITSIFCPSCGRSTLTCLYNYDYQMILNAVSSVGYICEGEISVHQRACSKQDCKGKNIELVKGAFSSSYDGGGSNIVAQLALFSKNFTEGSISKKDCLFLIYEIPGVHLVLQDLSRQDPFAFKAAKLAVEELCRSMTPPPIPETCPCSCDICHCGMNCGCLNPSYGSRSEDVDLFDASKFVGYNVSGDVLGGAKCILVNYNVPSDLIFGFITPLVEYLEDGITNLDYDEYSDRIRIVDQSLNSGYPIIVKGRKEYISRSDLGLFSDYFLVIVGRKYDENRNGYVYQYLDPSKSDSSGYSSSNILYERGSSSSFGILTSDTYLIVEICGFDTL